MVDVASSINHFWQLFEAVNGWPTR